MKRDDLVQARTPKIRKEKAEKVITRLAKKNDSITMSAVINQLLIYIDEHKELPFDMPKV